MVRRVHRRQHVGLLLERHGIDHVAQLVIPAALFCRVRPYLRYGTPQPQGAIRDHARGHTQATRRHVAEDLRPALGRFAMPTLDRQHDFAAVGQAGDQHEQRRLR